MKIRIAFLSLLAMLITVVASAQVVEYDDMYFNSKDRVKVTSARPVTMTHEQKELNQVVTPINPTDSYSARNVNPEYISQSKINPTEVLENAPYFTPDYTPTGVNQSIYNNAYPSNNYYNSMFNNPYGMSAFGSPFNSFYSPYSAFSPFGYGGMYPSSGWSSMWSIGMGFGYGMMGYPSMGMGMGWGCGYCFNSFYGYGMSPWGFGNYYPGGLVVISNPDNARPVTYGRRTSRSNDLNNQVYNNNRANGTTTTVVDANGKVRGAGGRTTSGNEPGSYYQRGWRENPATRPSSTWSNTNSNRSGTQSSWFDSNNSRSGGSRSGSDSFFNSGSRSSGTSSGSGFSSGGGSRSSGASSGSSGVRRGRD